MTDATALPECPRRPWHVVEVRGPSGVDTGGPFCTRCGEYLLVADPPRWVDLFGIDPRFTGDATTAEYLEATRGDA